MSNRLTLSAVIVSIVAVAAVVAVVFLRAGDDVDEIAFATGTPAPTGEQVSSPAAVSAPRQDPTPAAATVPELTLAPEPTSEKQQDPAPAAATSPQQSSAPKLAPASTAGLEQKEPLLPVALVAPDPDFERALSQANFSTRGWKTDFSRHSIPYDEISSGGVPRDGIPPLDRPNFTIPELASEWLADQEPVIALEVNGQAKAYPLQTITWHEIVNDTVGGVPVAVTFCPLCNSAIVFDRTIDGAVHTFGVSGNLRNSDLIMWDRQSETWWQQFTGEGIVGVLTGKRLKILPAVIVSWLDFKTANPTSLVLSRDTGFNRPYGSNPYAGYDRVDLPPFLFRGDTDGRLRDFVAVAPLGRFDRGETFESRRHRGHRRSSVDVADYCDSHRARFEKVCIYG